MNISTSFNTYISPTTTAHDIRYFKRIFAKHLRYALLLANSRVTIPQLREFLAERAVDAENDTNALIWNGFEGYNDKDELDLYTEFLDNAIDLSKKEFLTLLDEIAAIEVD